MNLFSLIVYSNYDLVDTDEMQVQTLSTQGKKSIDLKELITEARLSAKLCSCEGRRKISAAPINECEVCGHTACLNCSGNPKHRYKAIPTKPDHRTEPSDFESKWRSEMPLRLRLQGFPKNEEIFDIIPSAPNTVQENFLDVLQKADLQSEKFCLDDLKRGQSGWKVFYKSSGASLELVLDDKAYWLVYLNCPKTEPGDSLLRKYLTQPIARAMCKSSILETDWEVRTPKEIKCTLTIVASKSQTTSWKNDLGLVGFEDEMMPLGLEVESEHAEAKELIGTYHLQKPCGTAKNSLYKKAEADPPIFLFLDPDPLGPPGMDFFVFSTDCSRLPWGQARDIIGNLEPSFDPCSLRAQDSSSIQLSTPGCWTKRSQLALEVDTPSLHVKLHTEGAPTKFSTRNCSEVPVIFEVQILERLDTQDPSQYTWALAHASTIHCFSEWQQFDIIPDPGLTCDCSPKYPQIFWSVDGTGVTPYEDPQATSLFERQMKRARNIFQIHPYTSKTRTNIKFGVDFVSLVQKAKERLFSLSVQNAQHQNNKCFWRMLMNQPASSFKPFPNFRLQNPSNHEPYDDDLGLKHELSLEQKKLVSWMKSQESGVQMTITELEEDIHPTFKWRVESKAEMTLNIRAFVLADLPSFGKTVATIALIASDLRKKDFASLQDRSALIPPGDSPRQQGPSLITLAATLVICPPQIARQWKKELESWLDDTDEYKILLLENYSDLYTHTRESFGTAHVIIVSWTVLADERYVAQLARFSGMPSPAVTWGRGFEIWVDSVVKDIPS